MARDRVKMAERILHLTLEILFGLTGEDYTVVKKTSSERCQDPVSDGWGRLLSPITGPPPHPLIHEDINDQKILELTYKMIELLTGEVVIRCQDVTVYFSMEEWEYLEGHKDQYKDVMMEVPQPLISPVLSSERIIPERCPRPLLPQDCKQEDPNVPQDHQGKDLTHINTTETYVSGDERCKEEIPTDNSPGDCVGNSEGHEKSSDFKINDHGITQDIYKEHAIHQSPQTALCSENVTFVSFPKVLSSDFEIDDHGIIQDTYKEHAIHQALQTALCSNNVTFVPFPKVLSSDFKMDDHGIIQDTNKEHTIHQALQTALCSNNVTFVPFSKVLSSHSSQQRKHLVRDVELTSHTERNQFSCSECGQYYIQRSTLVDHQNTCRGKKPYLCSKCGKCFNHESDLTAHQRSHRGERPYSCSECEKCFKYKTNLNVHQRTHTGVKPFSCSQCGIRFNHKSSLVKHEIIHTGEKPYSCSECGKCFNRKSTLTVHQRTHTGEKPFSCSECGVRFNQKSSLAIHERTHTGEKPFRCSQCGKWFTNKANLTAHQNNHTGNKAIVFSGSE
ncbi:uncharacterized protein [Phyllobates terribilis]|uniref:uncharacterized protein n=1 Tax=Phyllobates terribilis TaxID=111132 RepID=UPI003CCB4977